MASVKLLRYQALGMQWESLDRQQLVGIAEAANSTEFFVETDNQYRLYNCIAYETPTLSLTGYFAHQVIGTFLQFVGNTEAIQNSQYFETFLFSFSVNTGQVCLQTIRRIPNNLPRRTDIERRFVSSLNAALISSNIPPITEIRRLTESLTVEQMVALFDSNEGRSTYVLLEGFEKPLPEGFAFHNPREDLDIPYRESLSYEYRNVGKASLTARGNGDLRVSPFAKSFAHAARSFKVLVKEYYDGRRKITWRQNQKNAIPVDIQTEDRGILPQGDAETLVRVAIGTQEILSTNTTKSTTVGPLSHLPIQRSLFDE